MKKNTSLFIILLFAFTFAFAIIIIDELQLSSENSGIIFEKVFADTSSNLWYNQPLVSTRGDFDLTTGQLIGYSPLSYNALNIPGVQNEKCPQSPNKTVIYIHGYGVNGKTFVSENAAEIFSRVNMSLYNNTNNDIKNTVIGFNWDSDIIASKDKAWGIAKHVAKNNGLKLAQFLLDLKNKCPNIDLRLIAHSLGARVALSSLDILHNHPEWNDKNFTVKSVHLLAAAVDNEEISKNPFDIIKDPTNGYNMNVTELKYPPLNKLKSSFGEAIEDEVGQFYNLYSPKDDSLEWFYPLNEKDTALGLHGAENGTSLPSNYIDRNVQSQIKPFCDADGHNSCDYPYNIILYSTPSEGDNHFGYIGFRDANGTLKDDGAMDVVVSDWEKQEINKISDTIQQ